MESDSGLDAGHALAFGLFQIPAVNTLACDLEKLKKKTFCAQSTIKDYNASEHFC